VDAEAGDSNPNGTDVGDAAFNIANDPGLGSGNVVVAGGNSTTPGNCNVVRGAEDRVLATASTTEWQTSVGVGPSAAMRFSKP